MVGMMTIPASAQDSAESQNGPDTTTARVLDNARTAIGPISPEQRAKACRAETREGEIVVCAPGNGDEFRIKSETELDPTSRRATRDGRPRAPDLAPKYQGVKVLTACLVPPCPPPPMYMINLADIPETPKGSDAEKVAKGEMRDR